MRNTTTIKTQKASRAQIFVFALFTVLLAPGLCQDLTAQAQSPVPRIAVTSTLAHLPQPATRQQPTVAQLRPVIQAALEHIAILYIDPIPLDQLALGSLAGLTTISPHYRHRRHAGRLSLFIGERHLADFALPNAPPPQSYQARCPCAEIASWAHVIARAAIAVQAAAPKIPALNPEDLLAALLTGMTRQLDDYSTYVRRQEAEHRRADREGYIGIGVTLISDRQGARITRVMKQSPAEYAGLKAGDIIVAVDKDARRSPRQKSAQNIIASLSAQHQNSFMITIQSGNGKLWSTRVARNYILTDSLEVQSYDPWLYVGLKRFSSATAQRLRQAITNTNTLANATPQPQGLILDLRDNPGGLLSQAVSVSDLFVNRGLIASAHGRHPESHQTFIADAEDILLGRPLVVLINENSASAAEVVVAAIQGHGRGVVIGTPSYGKASVQTVLPLPNAAELTLTWARFHTPVGKLLHGKGIVPDLCTDPRGQPKFILTSKDFKNICSQTQKINSEGQDKQIALALEVLANSKLYESARKSAHIRAKADASLSAAAADWARISHH